MDAESNHQAYQAQFLEQEQMEYARMELMDREPQPWHFDGPHSSSQSASYSNAMPSGEYPHVNSNGGHPYPSSIQEPVYAGQGYRYPQGSHAYGTNYHSSHRGGDIYGMWSPGALYNNRQYDSASSSDFAPFGNHEPNNGSRPYSILVESTQLGPGVEYQHHANTASSQHQMPLPDSHSTRPLVLRSKSHSLTSKSATHSSENYSQRRRSVARSDFLPNSSAAADPSLSVPPESVHVFNAKDGMKEAPRKRSRQVKDLTNYRRARRHGVCYDCKRLKRKCSSSHLSQSASQASSPSSDG